jgi:hypothetical protein
MFLALGLGPTLVSGDFSSDEGWRREKGTTKNGGWYWIGVLGVCTRAKGFFGLHLDPIWFLINANNCMLLIKRYKYTCSAVNSVGKFSESSRFPGFPKSPRGACTYDRLDRLHRRRSRTDGSDVGQSLRTSKAQRQSLGRMSESHQVNLPFFICLYHP